MTLVMLWREARAQRIWLVSDSRLSSLGPAGGVTRLTDHGAKILEARAVADNGNPREPPIRQSMLAFAYCGSSLIALNAYAAVLPFWSRLNTIGEPRLPSIGDFANHLSIFVNRYAGELAAAGLPPTCTCILVGSDDASAQLRAWKVTSTSTPKGPEIKVVEIVLPSGHIELFGSGARHAGEQLAKVRRPTEGWGREPLDLIRASLGEDAQLDVGGGVQIGALVQDGFDLYFDAPSAAVGSARVGDPLAAFKYRGFAFEDVNKIGHAVVSLKGLSR